MLAFCKHIHLCVFRRRRSIFLNPKTLGGTYVSDRQIRLLFPPKKQKSAPDISTNIWKWQQKYSQYRLWGKRKNKNTLSNNVLRICDNTLANFLIGILRMCICLYVCRYLDIWKTKMDNPEKCFLYMCAIHVVYCRRRVQISVLLQIAWYQIAFNLFWFVFFQYSIISPCWLDKIKQKNLQKNKKPKPKKPNKPHRNYFYQREKLIAFHCVSYLSQTKSHNEDSP